MITGIGAAALLCLAALPGVALAQATADGPPKAVQISGRIISPGAGQADVRVERIEPDEVVYEETVRADLRGAFTFVGEPSKTYRISLGRGVKTLPKIIDTAGGKDIDLGDIILVYCPPAVDSVVPERLTSESDPVDRVGDLRVDQILIEQPSTGHPGSAAHGVGCIDTLPQDPRYLRDDSIGIISLDRQVSLDKRAEWEGLCEISFDRYLSVESFVGGKVKAIHVVRVSPDSKLTTTQIREEVRRVWLGVFRATDCHINWDEGTNWNIEASVEYEDGTRTSILMDGFHVEVQDRVGKFWFIRRSPA
jgi:hypothetical protein